MLKLFEVNFALAFEVQHHEADLIFFFLSAVVDNVCILDVADKFDKSQLG
jgi:hypothetical protein